MRSQRSLSRPRTALLSTGKILSIILKATVCPSVIFVEVIDASLFPTLIFCRGKVGKFVKQLSNDFKQVMEPFTATNLKVRPKNVIKDFVHNAGVLKVSHLVAFTKTTRGPYMKVGRFPRGPTITFSVEKFRWRQKTSPSVFSII